MPRHTLAALAALALALTSVAACKPESAGSGSGAPCKGANPNQSCYDCEMSTCPDQFAALESACGAFLACEAECTCSDISCLQACSGKIDAACASADDAAKECLGTKCKTECNTGNGTPTASCAKLTACCPTLPDNAVDGCDTTANANNESICAQQLANYQAATYCGGTSGGTSCADLPACCAAIADASAQQGCDTVVQSGAEASCAAALNGFKAAGYCP